MRCAVYARLSIEREASSDNVETQIEECSAHIDDQGWTVACIFSDTDISASRYGRKLRPGYNHLLDAVRAGEVECIVITEMPRLYRRLEELLELMHLAETTALKRIGTTDGYFYDLSTEMGVRNAVAAVNTAALESRRTSDRMKRKRRAEAVLDRCDSPEVAASLRDSRSLRSVGSWRSTTPEYSSSPSSWRTMPADC
jgi:DNA invertase Pin-like site-specific DNA recombinase